MRKFAVAFALVSLLACALQVALAQSRPRRVGQTGTTTPSTSGTTGDSSAPTGARPPTLGGRTTGGQSSGAATANAPANNNNDGAGVELGDDDTVRVETTLVTLPVSVVDRQGRNIPDLRQTDFRIYENNVEQRVAYFAAVERPFTVALVIDTSGSTRFRLEDIQDAAITFVEQLRPDDRVMVVAFDDEVRVLAEATGDRNALRNAIRRTRTGNGTRLYDAVDLILNQRFNRIQGRKAIVLFTDGVDTTSRRANYNSTVRDAEETDALIFPVQYDTYTDVANSGGGGGNYPSRRGGIILNLPFPFPIRIPGTGGGGGGGGMGSSRSEYERANAYLNDLSYRTGARLYRAEDTRNLTQVFSAIAEELRQQYSLGYYPSVPPRPGERRQVRVRANRPELVVRARDSYIYNPSGAPASPSNNAQRASQTPQMRRQPLASASR